MIKTTRHALGSWPLAVLLWLAISCGSRSADPSFLMLPEAASPAPDGTPGMDFGVELPVSGVGGSEGAPAPSGVLPGDSPAVPPSTDGNTFVGAGCIGGDTACTNCIDDDGDGTIDAFDTECTGPLDDDEATFATGIPGDNRDFCQDCFFDGNSGHGDDGCEYNTECLYGREPSTPARAGCFRCDVSDTCRSSCQKFTPNGCDCFGCCEVHAADGSVRNVRLDERCSQANLADETLCEACVPTLDCYNDCGPCEICVGRSAPAPDCNPSETPPSECGSGLSACSSDSPCPAGQYCLTGCCFEVPVIR